MDETKSSYNIPKVYLWGEQPKSNVDEVDILLIPVLGLSCFLDLFVILIPSPDVNIVVSHVE